MCFSMAVIAEGDLHRAHAWTLTKSSAIASFA